MIGDRALVNRDSLLESSNTYCTLLDFLIQTFIERGRGSSFCLKNVGNDRIALTLLCALPSYPKTSHTHGRYMDSFDGEQRRETRLGTKSFRKDLPLYPLLFPFFAMLLTACTLS